MDKSESKLAPCPWCNGINIKVHIYSEHVDGEPDAFCQCHDCSVIGPNGTDEDLAIAAWNKRAAPTSADSQEREVALSALSSIAYLAGDIEDDGLHNEIKDKVRIAVEAIDRAALAAPNSSKSSSSSPEISDNSAAPKQPTQEDDERAEDQWVIDRFAKILAGVAIALKGPELPLHRHGYHDLEEVATVMCLERDLLRLQVAELKAAPAPMLTDEQPWQPMLTAPLDGTEVELILRHNYWIYASGKDRAQWEQIVRAKWIDFNGGGWTWSGMSGMPVGWRAVLAAAQGESN